MRGGCEGLAFRTEPGRPLRARVWAVGPMRAGGAGSRVGRAPGGLGFGFGLELGLGLGLRLGLELGLGLRLVLGEHLEG